MKDLVKTYALWEYIAKDEISLIIINSPIRWYGFTYDANGKYGLCGLADDDRWEIVKALGYGITSCIIILDEEGNIKTIDAKGLHPIIADDNYCRSTCYNKPFSKETFDETIISIEQPHFKEADLTRHKSIITVMDPDNEPYFERLKKEKEIEHG